MDASLIIAAAVALTAATMVYDVMEYRLPNRLMLALLALYPFWVWYSPERIYWPLDLFVSLTVLLLGFAFFTFKWLGAGDVKMLAVSFLWVGMAGAWTYAAAFALVGGVMSLGLLFGRPIIAGFYAQDKLPKVLRLRAPIPYGIAIGGGMMWWWFTRVVV